MPDYTKTPAVIQSHWYNCWAAAMSWWTHATAFRGIPALNEEDFLKEFPRNWDKNGAMSIQGLTEIFNDQRFQMRARFSDVQDLDRIIIRLQNDAVLRMDAFPIVIGYRDERAGGNHLAVLCGFDAETSVPQKFITMDPARGFVTRDRDYFASQRMIYAWDTRAGDII